MNVLDKDSVFVLCSDGLYKFCRDSDLRNCARKCKDKKKMKREIETLVSMSYDNGAKDNLTVIMVKYFKR